MVGYFKSYLRYGNRFCGLEHTLKNGQEVIYTSLLKKHKHEVDVSKCFESNTLDEVTHKLHKGQHVFLVINNDQVLSKTLETVQTNDLNLVNQAFPNIDVSAFYYCINRQKNNALVSICRKSFVDDLIRQYQNKKIHVLAFTLGNTAISGIVSYLEYSLVHTSNATVTLQDNAIGTIQDIENPITTTYNIKGLRVTNHYLLSASAALSGITNTLNINTNYQDKTSSLLSNYQQGRFFNLGFKTGLVAILLILLVNFIFYSYYFNKVNTLNQTSHLNQTTKHNIETLNESVSDLEKTVAGLLKTSDSKSAYYINAIVHSLPHSVTLSEINYQPLKKQIKPNKAIDCIHNMIVVSGKTQNSSHYSDWIAVLESMDWVQEVTVETYRDLKSASFFSIKINIAP